MRPRKCLENKFQLWRKIRGQRHKEVTDSSAFYPEIGSINWDDIVTQLYLHTKVLTTGNSKYSDQRALLESERQPNVVVFIHHNCTGIA